jgi:hypothetical protein
VLVLRILVKYDHSPDSWRHLFSVARQLYDATRHSHVDEYGKTWTVLLVDGFLCSVERIMWIARLDVRPQTVLGYLTDDGRMVEGVLAEEWVLQRIEKWILRKMLPHSDVHKKLKAAQIACKLPEGLQTL